MLRGASSIGTSGGGIGLKSAGVLAQSAVPASVTGTVTKTVLATVTIPANSLGPNGALRVLPVWSCTNNANSKTLGVDVSGTPIVNVSGTSIASKSVLSVLRNRNAPNQQVSMPVGNASGIGSDSGAIATYAFDFSQSQTLNFFATLTVTTDTATLEGYTVEILNP